MPKKKEQVKPTYMKGKKPMKIGLHDVYKALKWLEEHGKIDEFMAQVREKNIVIKVDASTVNFVKDYVVEKEMHTHTMGAHIVNAKGTSNSPDFECNFGGH